jgi:serine/threonine protein kinase/formylglycine-generating enzyme required for sulfatase activity
MASRTPRHDFSTGPWQVVARVSQVRDDFELAWQQGRRRPIEVYLEGAAADERATLLWDLIALEVDLRHAAGEKPAQEEYERRFPNDVALVQAFFRSRGPALLERIGRYTVCQRLGAGGYGHVYLCHDERAERQVAIKMPRPDRLNTAQARAAFLREARHVARLDHPHIVPLYDIGEEDGQCFLVYKFIAGQSLFDKLAAGPVPPLQGAALLAQVAEALHHAHGKNVFHRDIKPGNILLDQDLRAYVTDFGLAIREEELTRNRVGRHGTIPYMAPEQVRGEGHRIDGRTDIYSLGIVLYELLTGRRPFSGKTDELFQEILYKDVRPPRQIQDTIPRELERICLKAMARQMSARHATAQDLADDLRLFQSATAASAALPAESSAAPCGQTPPSSSRAHPQLLPKGLRSFDAEDGDFFLELLPGPRDRDGLPESLRFWKTRIESRDPEHAFAVGLLYGPSGCGKSSLVKAGLLPRVQGVAPVYVEATGQNTEAQFARALRQACPDLDPGAALPEMVAELRRGRDLPGNAKVLIVLDQFEQWLHVHGGDMEVSALVGALRHADGRRVQVLLLVRDDFWLATSRLFDLLEINLDRARNARVVDLFDLQHASRILAAFGQAFERLPPRLRDLSAEQGQFLDSAVAQLGKDDRIIPVRLSLFADLMKDRPWTEASLLQVGGAEGVGLRFLEETFSARTALPDLRAAEKPVRALLQALLPERGIDLKGGLRSRQELAEACGLEEPSPRFARLLEILDRTLHIITPTEMESGTPSAPAAYYQLTHDYLVPPLRQWLTQQQRSTWRGRAELCLQERAAQWARTREARFLPSTREFVQIALGVPTRKRKPEQQHLMRFAARHYRRRWGLGLLAALLMGLALQWYVVRVQGTTQALVHAVLAAAAPEVPHAIEQLQPVRGPAAALLRARLDDPASDPLHRLHAAMGLAACGEAPQEFLVAAIATAPADECRNLINALATGKATAITRLREQATTSLSQEVRQAIVLLHLGDDQTARKLLAYQADPARRTAFILGFAPWHGDLTQLLPLLRATDDAALHSGLAAALGTVPVDSLTGAEQQDVTAMLQDLYVQAPDGATHSATGWALRQRRAAPVSIPATPGPVRGQRWFVNQIGTTMIEVPAGTFTMGDGNYGDAETHRVQLTRPCFVGDTEVRADQFERFLADPACPAGQKPVSWPGPDRSKSPTPDCPVQRVSWNDAVLFCNWLSAREGRRPCYRPHDQGWEYLTGANGYRLLTEAEWEHACRAGTTTEFSFGNNPEPLTEHGFFVPNSKLRAWPVANRLPNAFGLFDLHGNVSEWCWDWYGPYAGDAKDPVGPATGTERVIRGGGWYVLEASGCSAAARARARTDRRTSLTGFRLACKTEN